MKIAIISDSHDNIPNIEKAIAWIKDQGIDKLIHCGDVCAPGVLKKLCESFSGDIFLCLGNVDGDHFMFSKISYEDCPNLKMFKEFGEIELGGKKIAINHYPDFAKALAHTGKYDIVFHGHTHKPWEEETNGCRVVNPGNICGFPVKASFAVYDTESGGLELKILEQIK